MCKVKKNYSHSDSRTICFRACPTRSTHEPNSLIFYTSKLKRRLCSCPSWVEWSPIIFSRCSKRVRWVEDLMVFFLSFHSRFWIVTKSAALLATINWAKIQFLDLYRVILKRGLGNKEKPHSIHDDFKLVTCVVSFFNS